MSSQNERRTHSAAIHRRAHRNRPDGLVEVVMPRYKVVIGWALRARTLPTPKAEAKIDCKVLNVMTALGMPISCPIA